MMRLVDVAEGTKGVGRTARDTSRVGLFWEGFNRAILY